MSLKPLTTPEFLASWGLEIVASNQKASQCLVDLIQKHEILPEASDIIPQLPLLKKALQNLELAFSQPVDGASDLTAYQRLVLSSESMLVIQVASVVEPFMSVPNFVMGIIDACTNNNE